ncbi:6324_t:CDS:1, partial [Acaulospora colombiana]
RSDLLKKDPVGLLRMVLQHEACVTLRNPFIQTICGDREILEKDLCGLLQIILQHEACVAHRNNFIEAIYENVDILKKDLVNILQVSFANKACNTLKNLCILIYCLDAETFFESPYFLKLKKSHIKEILLQDYISLDEIQIWNYLLKWGAAQSSLDLNNRDEWTVEEFLKLRDIFQELIPLVRWFQIPAAEFRKEMKLFKSLLSEDLFLDVIGYSLDPNTPPNTVMLPSRILSSLISKDQFRKLTDKINERSVKIYEGYFKLLYRASRDGFKACDFHRLCDDKGATVFIAKCQGPDELIGGYNPFSWKSYSLRSQNTGRSWGDTAESFLFSFDGLNLNNIVYPLPQDTQHAVSYDTN